MNKINFNSIREKALSSRKVERKADSVIENKLNVVKKNFLDEFDNHPITQELAGKILLRIYQILLEAKVIYLHLLVLIKVQTQLMILEKL